MNSHHSNVTQRLPRSVPPLQRLCLAHVASNIDKTITNTIIHAQNDDELELAVSVARKWIHDTSASLPQDLVASLVKYLLEATNYTGVLIAFQCPNYIDSIETKYIGTHESGSAFPINLPPRLASNLDPNLLHLDVNGLIIQDSFLHSLISSPCASNLQSFSCSAEYLTATALNLCARFPRLRKLQLDAFNSFRVEDATLFLQHKEIEDIVLNVPISLDDRAVFAAFLAPEALPKLKRLDFFARFPSQSDVAKTVVELLSCRPSASQLEKLRLGIDMDSLEERYEILLKIHQLCPNLQHLFDHDFPFDELDRSQRLELFSNVKNLTKANFFDISERDLNEAAVLFPHMRQIRLLCTTAPSSLAAFSNLRAIFLECEDFGIIKHYPPHLQTLQIAVTEQEEISATEVDQFLDCVFTTAASLTHIDLRVPGDAFHPKHAVEILSRCQNLTRIGLRNGEFDENAPETHRLEVSHPRLESYSICITGLALVPCWLPSLTLLHETIDEAETFGNDLYAPSLNKLILMNGDDTDPNDYLAKSVKVLEHCALHTKLEFVQLVGAPSPMTPILSCIFNLKHITAVVIESATRIETSSMLDLLSGLPLLAQLDASIVVDSTLPHEWLRHPRLTNMRLELHHCEENRLSEHPSVVLTPKNLPLLRDLGLLSHLTIKRVHIEDLPLLSLCDIFVKRYEKAPINTDICIKNCEYLQSISLETICVGDMEISAVPKLKSLRLRLLTLNDSSTRISTVDVPQRLEGFHARLLGADETFWRQNFVSHFQADDTDLVFVEDDELF